MQFTIKSLITTLVLAVALASAAPIPDTDSGLPGALPAPVEGGDTGGAEEAARCYGPFCAGGW